MEEEQKPKMAAVVSTVRGIIGLIDSLGISGNYPDRDWVNSDLVPTLRTLATQLGAIEQSLHYNNSRDWVLWVIVSVSVLMVGATTFLLHKQMFRTRSKGVVSVGSKINVKGEQSFPDLRF